MADGVDHIDIYADVEEEFSQVLTPLSAHFDQNAPAFCIFRTQLVVIVVGEWRIGAGQTSFPGPSSSSHHAASLSNNYRLEMSHLRCGLHLI